MIVTLIIMVVYILLMKAKRKKLMEDFEDKNTMHLKVVRSVFNDNDTQGFLYVDGVQECATLEPTDRGLDTDMSAAEILARKIFGKTAIPVNTPAVPAYEVTKDYWPAPHDKYVPTLNDVPAYSGVGIHSVGTVSDTLACLGVGQKNVGENLMSNGFAARDALYTKIWAAMAAGKKIFISYERNPAAWAAKNPTT